MDAKCSCISVWTSFFRFAFVSKVKQEVNKTVARLFEWSLRTSMDGVWPDKGFRGEALKGLRKSMAGKPLANGWRRLSFINRYK